MFIFILLGTQVDFALIRHTRRRSSPVFMLVARRHVFPCALPDRRARWSVREMLFMCWTRETGVIPARWRVCCGMKAPGAKMIASVTFIAILMTILIQAPTTKWLGKRPGTFGNETALVAVLGGGNAPSVRIFHPRRWSERMSA